MSSAFDVTVAKLAPVNAEPEPEGEMDANACADAVAGRDAVVGRAGAELRSGGAEHGRFAPAAAAPVNVERSDAEAPLTQSTPRGADWLITAVRPLAPTQAQRTEPRNWPAGIWQTESAVVTR